MPHKVVRVPSGLSTLKERVNLGLFLLASGTLDMCELLSAAADRDLGSISKTKIEFTPQGLDHLSELQRAQPSESIQSITAAALLAVSHIENPNQQSTQEGDSNAKTQLHDSSDQDDLDRDRSADVLEPRVSSRSAV